LFFLMANKVGLSGMSQTRTDLQRPRTQNNKNEIRTSSRGETVYLNCVPGTNKSTNGIIITDWVISVYVVLFSTRNCKYAELSLSTQVTI